MLEKAQKILQVGSVVDIQNFLPQLIQAYCKLDIEQAKLEKIQEKIQKKLEKWLLDLLFPLTTLYIT